MICLACLGADFIDICDFEVTFKRKYSLYGMCWDAKL